MGPKPSGKHTIHRIDNDLGYFPANCVWATSKEQGRHKTNSVYLKFGGIKKCATEWAEINGIRPSLIYGRIRRGWPNEFLLLPSFHNGVRLSLSLAAKLTA